MSCQKCVNVLFYILNTFLLILGLASLGVGIWMAVDPVSALKVAKIGELGTVTPELIRVSGYIMIAAGGATFLFSIFGIVGACTKNRCILGLYITLLVLALALQVTVIVLGVVFQKQLKNELKDVLYKSLENYEGPNSSKASSSAWDTFMSEVKCCGIVNGTDDFMDGETKWNRGNSTDKVPPACCSEDGCGSMPDSSNSYTMGCLAKVLGIIKTYSAVIIGVSAGIVGFQFLLVVLAVCVVSLSGKDSGYAMRK